MPKVSVIIPNYNHAPFLEQRIESVLYQTFQDFEVIILDDCSTDYSLEVIEIYRNDSRVSHIIFNDINSGSPFKQWKKGFELAQGEYIWIAESDDYSECNFLEIAIQSILKEDADLFVAKTVRVDENNKFIDDLAFWYEDLDSRRWNSNFVNDTLDEIRSFLVYKNTIVNTSGVLFKKFETIEECLKLSQEFKSCGDWLFWLTYLKNAQKIVYSVNTKNYFRTHVNTTRSNIPYERNYEILKIYKWVCINILGQENNTVLLSYYFKNFIKYYPRKSFINNFKFIFNSLKYSLYCPYFILRHYLAKK